MKIRVISCAEQEFAEAVDYYNKQFPGLGYEFAAEVNNTFDRIKSFPNACPLFPTVQDDVLPIDFLTAFCIKPDKALSLSQQ